MTHDELKDALPALALDALDPAERDVVMAHVRGCAECQAELVTLQRVADGIGLEAAPVNPPAALKGKVLEHIGVAGTVRTDAPRREVRELTKQFPPPPPQPPIVQRLMPLALAASVLIAFGALYYAWTLRRDMNELTQMVRIVQAPDLLRVELKGQGSASAAIGRAMWSRSGGLLFMADRLPPLPAGRVYQLWTITGTAATGAGLLTPDPSGSASIRVNVPAGAPRPDAFGVTIEPAGGSSAPTLPIILLGSASQ